MRIRMAGNPACRQALSGGASRQYTASTCCGRTYHQGISRLSSCLPIPETAGFHIERHAGLDPSIYTHPIGLHGHGAGPSIGFWDNQNADPRGSGVINANTAWSIELTTYAAVPEWGGQRVDFRSEENAFFDGKTVRFIDGRQTEITLIPSEP
jgi:hypothetical protein